MTRVYDEGWLEVWMEDYNAVGELVTEQLAYILAENPGSEHAIRASTEMHGLGFESDTIHNLIVDQLAKGYGIRSLLVATEYLEIFDK